VKRRQYGVDDGGAKGAILVELLELALQLLGDLGVVDELALLWLLLDNGLLV